MSVESVYNIEKELEDAVSTLFSDLLTTYTAQSPPEFQKARARVEVEAVLGAGKGHLVQASQSGFSEDVEDAWDATVTVWLVTEADAVTHGSYRAQVRYWMAQLPSLIATGNTTQLVNHCITGPMKHTGSSPTMEPEDGVFHTQMNYQTIVSVHQDAWAKLSQPGI